MSVEGLEDGWLSHPFWRERFVIRSPEDLTRVRNGGTNLYIDVPRGTCPRASEPRPSSLKGASSRALGAERAGPPLITSTNTSPTRFPRRVTAPPAFNPMDRAVALAVAKRSTKIISEVFDDCRRGHPVVMPQIASVVKDIADTLDHNSVAFSSVTRLRDKDGYTYTHSIAVCALMITLGRANGATPREVFDLGIAGMLHDIGKLSIDSAILGKAGALDDEERAMIRLHPEMGHNLLAADPQVPSVALDVCLHHHERLDGTGYPFGLQGDQLTTAARAAVICDIYDAMTSNRPYKKGKSPIEAITELETMHDVLDQGLLLKFMRSIGVYPLGKLVRLRSNRLGVIMATTAANSRPAARVFYNVVDGHFLDYQDVILGDSFRDDQVVRIEEPQQRFGIDWSTIRDRILAGRTIVDRSTS